MRLFRVSVCPLLLVPAALALSSVASAQPKPAPATTTAPKPAPKPAKPKPPAPKPAPKPDAQPKPADAAAPATGAAGPSAPAAAPEPWSPAPGVAADPAPIPPPPPPPWSGTGPTSTSGNQLLPPQTAPAAGAPPAAEGTAEVTRTNRFKMLEARVHADEVKAQTDEAQLSFFKRLKVSGYIQPQLLVTGWNAAGSPNASGGVLPAGIGANDVIAKSDGTTTNNTMFRMRRTRLMTQYLPTDYARITFEFDPILSGGATPGTGTIARNVEAAGIVKWADDLTSEFAMGIFKLPFGFEVMQTDADRPFIERSWGEQNLFPAEFDTGARASLAALRKSLNVYAAVVNGQTIGEKDFAILPDLNRGKDVLGRMNFNFGPFDLGASAYYGQGQIVDAKALKFKQYPRWAVGYEAAIHHTFIEALGKTKLFAEIDLAQNMDRGVNYGRYGLGIPVMPPTIGADVQDLDERSLFVRLEQDITRWATIGARYDFYSPDTAQKNNARDTYAFVAVAHFTKGLQFMAEFDHAIDNVHVPNAPPPSKQIETVSGVLQARF